MNRSLALYLSLSMMATPVAVAEKAFAQKPLVDVDARQIVERQLAAFQRDDAEEAYSYTTPQIQAQFPDANLFLSTIADAFPAVCHHRDVEFGPAAEDEDGAVSEAVIVTDVDGQVWNAIYKLEKEPKGAWRISGVVLEKSDQKAI